jgi:hypothetical protein
MHPFKEIRFATLNVTMWFFVHEVVLVKLELQTHTEHLSSCLSGLLLNKWYRYSDIIFLTIIEVCRQQREIISRKNYIIQLPIWEFATLNVTMWFFAHEVVLVKLELQTHTEHLSSCRSRLLFNIQLPMYS